MNHTTRKNPQRHLLIVSLFLVVLLIIPQVSSIEYWLQDKSGNGNTLTAVSTPVLNTTDNSVYFNGVAYLTAPDSNTLSTFTGNMTVTFWTKTNLYQQLYSFPGYVYKSNLSTNAAEYSFFLNNGFTDSRIAFRADNGTSSNTEVALIQSYNTTEYNNTWTFISMTVQNCSTMKGYANTKRNITTTSWTQCNNIFPNGNGALYIGSRGTSSILNGSMRDIRIFNKSLSQSEIDLIYNNKTVACNNLMAWYDFVNNTGTTCINNDIYANITINKLNTSTITNFFYGANTHGRYLTPNMALIDTNNDGTLDTPTNTTYHNQKWNSSGLRQQRIDMPLDNLVYESIANGDAESWGRITTYRPPAGTYNVSNNVPYFWLPSSTGGGAECYITRSTNAYKGTYSVNITAINASQTCFIRAQLPKSFPINTNFTFGTTIKSPTNATAILRISTSGLTPVCTKSDSVYDNNWTTITSTCNLTSYDSSGYYFVIEISAAANKTILWDEAFINNTATGDYLFFVRNETNGTSYSDGYKQLFNDAYLRNDTVTAILAYMPSSYANTSDPSCNVNEIVYDTTRCPPKNFDQYGKAVMRLLNYTINQSQLSNFIFEEWNEQDLNKFWMGNTTNDTYRIITMGKMNNATNYYLDQWNTNAKYACGGYSTVRTNVGNAFLNYCLANQTYDYIATHQYGCDYLDEDINNELTAVTTACNAYSVNCTNKILLDEWNCNSAETQINNTKKYDVQYTIGLFTLLNNWNIKGISTYQWSESYKYTYSGYPEKPRRWTMVSEPLLDNAEYTPYNRTTTTTTNHQTNQTKYQVTNKTQYTQAIATNNGTNDIITIINKETTNINAIITGLTGATILTTLTGTPRSYANNNQFTVLLQPETIETFTTSSVNLSPQIYCNGQTLAMGVSTPPDYGTTVPDPWDCIILPNRSYVTNITVSYYQNTCPGANGNCRQNATITVHYNDSTTDIQSATVHNSGPTTVTFNYTQKKPVDYIRFDTDQANGGFTGYRTGITTGATYLTYFIPTLYISNYNLLNNNPINNFCTTVTNSTFTTTKCTYNNSIITFDDTEISYGTYNINNYYIGSGYSNNYSYYNTTQTYTYNLTNYNSTTGTYQARINISAYRLFLNTTINNFNTTNGNNITQINNNGIIIANNGTNNIQINTAGNYTKNISCTGITLTTTNCNATNIYDNIYTFNATDIWNDINIQNFTILINNTGLGGQLYNLSTTNGTIQTPLLQGYTYTIGFYTNGTYEQINTTITPTTNTGYYTFQVFPGFSIDITIKNANNLSLITSNTTITLLGNNTGYTYTTTTGGYLITNILAGQYLVTITNPQYTTGYYIVTATSGSISYLTAYLDQNATQEIIFTSINRISQSVTLPDTTISQYKIINNTWQIINTKQTDITGRTTFNYQPNTNYRFTASKTGYVTQTFNLNPILFSTYTIKMSPDTNVNYEEQNTGVQTTVTPTTFYNNQQNQINISIYSPTGRLQTYTYTITTPNEIITQTGTQANGELFTKDFNITTTDWLDKIHVNTTYTTTQGTYTTTNSYYILSNTNLNTWSNIRTNNYNMSLLERLFLGTIILIIIAGLTTAALGPIPGLTIGIIILLVYVKIGLYEPLLAASSIIVGLLVLFSRSE